MWPTRRHRKLCGLRDRFQLEDYSPSNIQRNLGCSFVYVPKRPRGAARLSLKDCRRVITHSANTSSSVHGFEEGATCAETRNQLIFVTSNQVVVPRICPPPPPLLDGSGGGGIRELRYRTRSCRMGGGRSVPGMINNLILRGSLCVCVSFGMVLR